MADEKVYEGEYYEPSEAEQAVVRQEYQPPMQMGAGMVQTRTPFQTSLQVLERRSLAKVEQEILRMATLLGDDAFYGWGSGKNHVEGGTIYLANALIHIYRNAVVVSEPVQDMPEAWIFTHTWLDLESQTSTTRQFI